MKKIPTIMVRNPNDRAHVLAEITPGCEWVFAGEGKATRKYDGTCVLVTVDGVFARREVKPGKTPPPNFVEVEHDETTGKTVGWEPAEQSGFAKYIAEAVTGMEDVGTYELCGPKINGNPEGFESHTLVEHANAIHFDSFDRPTFGLLFNSLPALACEGIVWHHPDGRMAKLKRRDMPSWEKK